MSKNINLPERIGKPAQRALAASGVTRLEQLEEFTEAEILKLHGVGRKALGPLREALAAIGRSFKGGDGKIQR